MVLGSALSSIPPVAASVSTGQLAGQGLLTLMLCWSCSLLSILTGCNESLSMPIDGDLPTPLLDRTNVRKFCVYVYVCVCSSSALGSGADQMPVDYFRPVFLLSIPLQKQNNNKAAGDFCIKYAYLQILSSRTSPSQRQGPERKVIITWWQDDKKNSSTFLFSSFTW